jgi:hypothetical protein
MVGAIAKLMRHLKIYPPWVIFSLIPKIGYALVIARTTKNKDEITRVYLRCDRGGRPKAGQENTRLIGCKFQLAGHLREGGWMLSCDQTKGKIYINTCLAVSNY